MVRDDPTPSTRLDEVCLRNGKCGDKTNSRPSSRSVVAPPLDARPQIPDDSRKRGGAGTILLLRGALSRAAAAARTLQPLQTARPSWLPPKDACTPRATRQLVDRGQWRAMVTARLSLRSIDSPKSPPSPVDDGPRRTSPHERHQA